MRGQQAESLQFQSPWQGHGQMEKNKKVRPAESETRTLSIFAPFGLFRIWFGLDALPRLHLGLRNFTLSG